MGIMWKTQCHKLTISDLSFSRLVKMVKSSRIQASIMLSSTGSTRSSEVSPFLSACWEVRSLGEGR